jgi:MSHA biogenesis protein MshM
MVLQHFGLKHYPLGKAHTELWDDGFLARLNERFNWLLESPGVGLLTGEAGVGKTAALRQLTRALNPHRYQVVYLAETDFGRLDLCCPVARYQGPYPGIGRRQKRRADLDY